jgi:hypothetical protein
MPFTNYSIIPSGTLVVLDGVSAFGVDMTGIPLNVSAIQWYGLRNEGVIEYAVDPLTGVLPNPGSFVDPLDYEIQTTEAEAIIEAISNPVIYYFTSPTYYAGRNFFVGEGYTSTEVGHPAPPNTTTDVPPVAATGQTLYWYDGAWVTASFNPNLTLAAAKTSLIQTVTQDGAAAVNAELGLYSPVQQISAPDINALDTATYPGTTIGEFQTYVNDLVASSTAAINAATTTEDLYPLNPAEVPFIPGASGTLNLGRGAFGNPLDLNPSWMVTWNSSNIDVTDTELFAPATNTTMPFFGTYGTPFNYDDPGSVFTLGNYTIQLRQTSTGFVLAEFVCPETPPTNTDFVF